MKKLSLFLVVVLLSALAITSVSAASPYSLTLGANNFTPNFLNPTSVNNPIYYNKNNTEAGALISGIESIYIADGFGCPRVTADFYIAESDTYDIWFRYRNGYYYGENIHPLTQATTEQRMFKAKVDGSYLQDGGTDIVFGEMINAPAFGIGWYWEKATVALTPGWHTVLIDAHFRPDIGINPDPQRLVRIETVFVTNESYMTSSLPNSSTGYNTGIGTFADTTAPTITTLDLGTITEGSTTRSRALSWTASDNKGIIKYEIWN